MSRRTTRLAAALAASAAAVTPLFSLAIPNATAAQTETPATCHLAIIKDTRSGVPANAGNVAFDQGNDEIYVIGQNASGQGGVEVISGRTYKPITFIPTGKEPEGIGINPGTSTIYVTDMSAKTLSVINGSTNKVTATIPVVRGPEFVAVDQRNSRVYVASFRGDISIINSATGKVTGTIHLGEDIQDAALNQATGLLYATNDSYQGNPAVIYVVNVTTRKVVDKIHPGGQASPGDIAVNPRTNTVYLTDSPVPAGRGFFVLNGSTNQITAKITTDLLPGPVTLNPKTNLVYDLVGVPGGSSVMEIDGRDNKIVGTEQVSQFDARSIAVNAPGPAHLRDHHHQRIRGPDRMPVTRSARAARLKTINNLYS